jgi:hypothetical protein
VPKNLVRLLVALSITFALVAGVLVLTADSQEVPADAAFQLIQSYESSPEVEGLFASKPPCAPYNQGLCKLTSYSCFLGTCCCTWRTDCDPAHASTECFPE